MIFVRWVILLLFLPFSLHAGFERPFQPASAYCPGTGGAASNGIGCWLVNPASLAGTQGVYLLGAFNPAPFGLTELKESGVAGAWNTKIGSAGAAASIFGFSLYKEFTGRISWGSSVGPVFDVGVSLAYYHLTIQNYGSSGSVGFDAGIIAHLGSSLRTGLVIKNLNNPRIGTSHEPLPQSFTISAEIDLLPRVSVSTGLMKDYQFPVSLQCGLEYKPLDALAFSVGASNEPSIVAGGFGFSFSHFLFEYAVQYHQPLGVSHFITFAVSFAALHGDR